MISFIVFLAILDCGRVTPQGDPLVVGGNRARHGELPWHVGVYQKTSRPYKQICGGSIVSRKLVISAAHCFWNTVEKLTPASRYAVAAGKIYKPWDELHDPDAQHSNVSELMIPPLFRGVDRNFAEDLALLVLERPFDYRPYLRPACLDFDLDLEENQLQPGNKGKVAGWGLTSASGKKTTVLNVIDLPIVDTEECLQKSPKSYWEFITIDKICAGYDNGEATLCQGDSGGGLVFPYTTEPGVERYYLRGVVSTSPSSATLCNAFAITSFTKISVHRKFIELRYNQETVEESLPPTIDNDISFIDNIPDIDLSEENVTNCGTVLMDRNIYSDEAMLGEVPWHVGFYDTRYEIARQICGGSIVGRTKIITAAHCFLQNGLLRGNEEFLVIAGKIDSMFYDRTLELQQSIQIKQIRRVALSDQYIGANTSFANDIAVVEVDSPFHFSERVKPVCVGSDEGVRHGEIGMIASWLSSPGAANSSTFASQSGLQVMNQVLEDRSTCLRTAPARYQRFVTSDKFCATGSNVICQQDSGSGIAHARFTDEEGTYSRKRYFLLGIAAGHTALRDAGNDACKDSNFTAFTDISKHEEFLRRQNIVIRISPNVNNTQLNAFFKNGTIKPEFDVFALPTDSSTRNRDYGMILDAPASRGNSSQYDADASLTPVALPSADLQPPNLNRSFIDPDVLESVFSNVNATPPLQHSDEPQPTHQNRSSNDPNLLEMILKASNFTRVLPPSDELQLPNL